MLKAAGIEEPESVNACLKSGIQRGFYKVEGAESLDKVIATGRCHMDYCKKSHKVTIKMVLYQSECGGDYEDGNDGAAIQCTDECMGTYVSELCQGKPEFVWSQSHNHCTDCSGFGECIGDHRNEHCYLCNQHYFPSYYSRSGVCDDCEEMYDSDEVEEMLDKVMWPNGKPAYIAELFPRNVKF